MQYTFSFFILIFGGMEEGGYYLREATGSHQWQINKYNNAHECETLKKYLKIGLMLMNSYNLCK